MNPEEAQSAGDARTVRGRCANHPELDAVLTCSRCGDYACTACASRSASPNPMCQRCWETDYESRRKELGPHERQVRAIALYYWVIGGAVGAATVGLFASEVHAKGEDPIELTISMVLVLLALAGFFCAAGWQLLRFTKPGQVLGVIAALPGLCSLPIGTFISGFILWALLGEKGQRVFSAEYRAAIVATPQLRFGVSLVTKIVLGVLLAVVIAGVVAAALGGLK